MNKEKKILPSGWKEVCLGDVCKFTQGVQVDLKSQKKEKFENSVPFLRIENYTQNSKDLRYISENLSKRKLISKNDIVVVRYGATAGFIGRGLNGILANNLFTITPTNEALSKDFLFLKMKEEKTFFYFQNTMTGGAMPALSFGILKPYKITLPPIEEQERIAEVLGCADSVIELTVSKISKLKLQKKSLMQKLLTPKSHWTEKRLSDLGKTYNGLTGKTKEDFSSGNSKFITYMNIFSNSKIDLDNLGQVQVNKNEKQNKAKYGDLFFTISSETAKEVGMASVLLEEVDNLYLNSFSFGFRLNDFNKLKPEFAQFLLSHQDFRKKMWRLAQGATRYNLSKTNFVKEIIKIPPLKEQDEIAEVLKTQDAVISLNEQKLQNLKLQKKSLMQKLLTGEWRV